MSVQETETRKNPDSATGFRIDINDAAPCDHSTALARFLEFVLDEMKQNNQRHLV